MTFAGCLVRALRGDGTGLSPPADPNQVCREFARQLLYNFPQTNNNSLDQRLERLTRDPSGRP
jgi:hypothetical protein